MTTWRPRPEAGFRVIAAALCGVGLAACDHFDLQGATTHLPHYQVHEGRSRTILDTALDACPDKTEPKEQACVLQALRDHAVSVPALVAMVPNCAAGHLCAYRHTSEDRLGFIPVMAEHFVVHWLITFDLTKPTALAADAPIKVTVE